MSGSIVPSVFKQAARGIRARGTQITLRRATKTAGPAPSPIPPTVENPVLAEAAAANATTISIAAAAANGALVPGDLILISGAPYTVQAQVASTGPGAQSPGFAGVDILPGLSAAQSAGAPLSFTFIKDVPLYGTIASFAQNLIDGTSILASDLQIRIAAWDTISSSIIAAPQNTDKVIFNGALYEILSVRPILINGCAAEYAIQVRG